MSEQAESGLNLTRGQQTQVAIPPTPSTDGQQVAVDDSRAYTRYANFARVTGTPEELIVDLGLNAQPFGVGTQLVQVDQRIVMGYYTAKRLMAALHLSVQRHEGAFGAIELDVQRRLKPPMRNS